jgi:gamma-glutamyltranspeptidase/glutathione hydrolase
VADNLGNVVSLTQTLSRSFGAKVATRGLGFPYNNSLAVFNADDPRCPGYLRPNTPMMTLMSPTIVLKDDEFVAALGTPGSEMIPPVISEIISNLVDRKMGIRAAVTAPRVLWWDRSEELGVYIEVVDPITKKDVKALRRMGFTKIYALRYPPRGEIKMSDFGAINAVAYDPETGVFTGVGDPRRYGSAMGPTLVAPGE